MISTEANDNPRIIDEYLIDEERYSATSDYFRHSIEAFREAFRKAQAFN